MTAASRWADGLWEMLTGRSGNCTEHGHCEKCGACILDFKCGACGHVQVDPYGLRARNKKPAPCCLLHGGDFIEGDHNDCIVNTCRVCANPVTNGQINDGDAHPDGDDAETWVHRECAQGEKYGD